MQGVINQYLASDHTRLDKLLQQSVVKLGAIAMEPYGEFRKGLLRHISMEEKVVLPTIARLQGGKKAEIAERIRLDHGALVALLVPPPSSSIVNTIISILELHNALEEEDGGLYQLLDNLSGPDADKIVEQLKAVPPVPVLPHKEKPEILEATRRAVERAGYKLKDMT